MSCLCGLFVSAREKIPEGLPVIIRWEAGSGYDRSGNRITGGWAYDTVNEAGRYVLFDENGMVQKKAENWENRDKVEEAFTHTEQESGIIALRLELFDGFEGEVTVTVESERGILGKYPLSSENLYECNIPVPSGVYRIQKAEAVDSQCVYAVEYAKEPFQMEEQGLQLLWVKVSEQEIGEVQSCDKAEGKEGQRGETIGEKRDESQPGGKKDEAIQTIREEQADSEYRNLKKFLIGGNVVVILAAGLLLRSKKNKYN